MILQIGDDTLADFVGLEAHLQVQIVLRPLRHLTHHNLVWSTLCSILQPSL